jgi:3-deoxy-manno-octulosonate cytidylyltransferase (CMP-KDO synthetase)
VKRRVIAVIPARLGSTRFPRKVLHLWHGKPLLSYLVKDLSRSKLIDRLVIATDSREIERELSSYDIEVVRTSKRHRTGSDRVAEVMSKIGGDLIINIQADNIGLTAPGLDRVIKRFLDEPRCSFATLARRIEDDSELFDPNSVKLVTDADNYALWFSRSPLPFMQGASEGERWRQFRFLHHIGVYLFRAAALKRFASWPRSPLEKAESLEQLRILENREKLRVFHTRMKAVSIDAPADLKKLDRLYK